MELIAHYQKLFDYDAWGNREALRSIDPAAPGLERILKLFGHIVGAERVWLARLEGTDAPPPWPELTLEECRSATDEINARWRRYLSGIKPAALGEAVVYRNTKGVEFRTPLADILQHLVTHSAYHRGQIAAAVRQAGGTPAATDYVVYVRQHPGA